MAIRDPQYGGYRVFVGDLGPKVLKQDLEKAFEQFGRLLDCWVARNPPGHAFLLFKYPREAERAVERMEGSMVSGRRIRVEHARPHEVRMKEISRRGDTHSYTISRDLPHRYGARPMKTSYKGPRPRDRGEKDWPPTHSRQWSDRPRKSPPSRYHSDHYDDYRRRRSWSHEHERYKRRRSEDRDRSPRDWPPRDRSPRDRSPRYWPPRDRSPKDRSPRDRSPRDRPGRDRSPRDRSPRDRSPRYRSPKDRSPSDRIYYEDREGTGSRSSRKLMSVAAPFSKVVAMKTDQGMQTDTELLPATDSCSTGVGAEQTTSGPTDKPVAAQSSSPVNGTLTTDVKCGPEDNAIHMAGDKTEKLIPVSGKADGKQTLNEQCSSGNNVAISKSSAKPEMSDSICGPGESKIDSEKSKGHLELNRPRVSLRLSPPKHRRSSHTAHTSLSSFSSSKYRRSSSTQARTSPGSSARHRRSSYTPPKSASGSKHRESTSIQVQTSPSSASGVTSGRRNWSGSDSESDMSEDDIGVSVTGGDVNGNEEVEVNLEMVQRDIENMVKKDSKETVKTDGTETVKRDSEETVKTDSDETITRDSEETVKKDSEETVKKDSEETVKKDSEETVKKDSEENVKKDIMKRDNEEMVHMVKTDSGNMVESENEKVSNNNEEILKRYSEDKVGKDSEDMVKKHTEFPQQINTQDIPLPEMTLS